MNADLARALVGLPGWPHRAPPPGTASLPQQTDPPCARNHDSGIRWVWVDGVWLPDLDDDATGGCLLGMLPPNIATDRAADRPTRQRWLVCVWNEPHAKEPFRAKCYAPTLGEACALALVAIGRVGEP